MHDVFDIFLVKKNAFLFMQDLDYIAQEQMGSIEDLLKEMKGQYAAVSQFFAAYGSLKGLNQAVLCKRLVNKVQGLRDNLHTFLYSKYFMKDPARGVINTYFLEIRNSGRLNIRHEINVYTLFYRLYDCSNALFELITAGTKREVQNFDQLLENILLQLDNYRTVLKIVTELKEEKKLSAQSHEQLIAKNGIPVQFIRNIDYCDGQINVLCAGKIGSIEEAKKQNEKYAYAFLKSVEGGLIPAETPLGEYGTLVYKISNGKKVRNWLESINDAVKDSEKSMYLQDPALYGYPEKTAKDLHWDTHAKTYRAWAEYAKKIEKVKKQIGESDRAGYIMQVEVLNGYEGKGYAKALMDIALSLMLMRDRIKVVYAIVESNNPDGQKMIGVFEKGGFFFFKDIPQVSYEKWTGRPEIDYNKQKYNLGIKFLTKDDPAGTDIFEKHWDMNDALRKMHDFLKGK